VISTECLALLDMLPSGIVIIRKDFSILFWNRCMEEWTGVKKGEILGKNLLLESPTLNQPSITTRLPQVFEGNTPLYLSSKFHPHLITSLLPDGTSRIQRGAVLPVRLGGDEVDAMLVIEDVTDLSHQVTGFQKMRDIARRELAERKKAEEALQIANAKLSLFSEITLQDIRNQLTAARGYNYLISHSLNDSSGIQSAAGKIDHQLSLIEKYISLMLDFEQLGKEPPQWYSLRQVIKRAMVQTQFFQVTSGPEIEDLGIYCPPLLERIFTNFLENAKEHGKTVTQVKISFSPRGDAGILTIEDDGVGVPTEDKEHIFGEGLGTKTRLTLYHTREVLAITGISIRETGVMGKGARFEIVIPKDGYLFRKALPEERPKEPE
jgi:PAS domain S-box-containing protein